MRGGAVGAVDDCGGVANGADTRWICGTTAARGSTAGAAMPSTTSARARKDADGGTAPAAPVGTRGARLTIAPPAADSGNPVGIALDSRVVGAEAPLAPEECGIAAVLPAGAGGGIAATPGRASAFLPPTPEGNGGTSINTGPAHNLSPPRSCTIDLPSRNTHALSPALYTSWASGGHPTSYTICSRYTPADRSMRNKYWETME